MSDFVPGFAARHDAAAAALVQAFPVPDFVVADIRERCAGGEAAAPRHFSPADPTANPTAGWDPLDPNSPPTTFVDPIEAARTAGYEEGYAAAFAAVQESSERDRALIGELATTLAAPARVDRERVARQLRETVLLLTTKLVGEVGVSADLLARRIDAAAELLADSAEAALLRVHPDDVALIEGRLPKTIFAAGDANLTRGSFVLESASTIVEDGPELWLEQLAAAIDRVPVPAEPTASC